VPDFGEIGNYALVRLPLNAPDFPSVFDLLKSHAGGVFGGDSSAPRGNKLDRLALWHMRGVGVRGRAPRQAPALFAIRPLE
jgi:hypothetical protein